MDTENRLDSKIEATEPSQTVKAARRQFLRRSLVTGVGATAVAAASNLSFNIRTAKAQTATWRIQTSWPGGNRRVCQMASDNRYPLAGRADFCPADDLVAV